MLTTYLTAPNMYLTGVPNMYCKRCGSDNHWTLYCDKEGRDENEVQVRRGRVESVCEGIGREGKCLDSYERGDVDVKDGKGGEIPGESVLQLQKEASATDGGGSGFSSERIGGNKSRSARWKTKYREKYNVYMREYMKRKRKKDVDKV